MTEKTFNIVNGDISDGYHTFDELYEHRHALFLYALKHGAFCLQFAVLDHLDGWDLVAAYTKTGGNQISYHIPISMRHLWQHEGFPIYDIEWNKWDGHTSRDVIARLNEG